MIKKKKYIEAFKMKVALLAIIKEDTSSDLSVRRRVNANMISKQKKQALDNMNRVFSVKHERSAGHRQVKMAVDL